MAACFWPYRYCVFVCEGGTKYLAGAAQALRYLSTPKTSSLSGACRHKMQQRRGATFDCDEVATATPPVTACSRPLEPKPGRP